MKILHFCNYIAHKKPIRYAFKCNKQKNLLFFFLGFTPCYLAAPPFTFSLKPRETACYIIVMVAPRTTAIRTLAE